MKCDDEVFCEFFSEVCNLFEQHAYGPHDDDMLHTSAQARHFASELLDILHDTGLDVPSADEHELHSIEYCLRLGMIERTQEVEQWVDVLPRGLRCDGDAL